MELVEIINFDYDRYEELLFEKDKLRKEAIQYNTAYIREFGHLINKVFSKRIACIRLKKMISYCQKEINKGNNINQNHLFETINNEMKLYNEQLNEMIEATKLAYKSKVISPAQVQMIKKLYRKLARKVHPDINPWVRDNNQIHELWNNIVIYYQSNDLESLQEAEIILNKLLRDNHQEEISIDIPNLQNKIDELEKEIVFIKENVPYTYKMILNDKDKVEEKKKELIHDFNEYEAYEKELNHVLKNNYGIGEELWLLN